MFKDDAIVFLQSLGDDEPVLIIRSSADHALETAVDYNMRLVEQGASPEEIYRIARIVARIRGWLINVKT
ncbi:MAG: hypothetical protein ACR2QF_12160 [Geminicoccaceae bacterium]